MNRAQLVVGTLSPTPRGCERICERNAAKLPRWAGTRRDGWDGRLAATCTFETRKPLRDVDRLAHNPEVHAFLRAGYRSTRSGFSGPEWVRTCWWQLVAHYLKLRGERSSLGYRPA